MITPTKITPNAAINAAVYMRSSLYQQNMRAEHSLEVKYERMLLQIVEGHLGNIIVDRDVDLKLSQIINLEILMDFEEQFDLIHKNNNAIDDEFGECKSFNSMLNCLIKYARN